MVRALGSLAYEPHPALLGKALIHLHGAIALRLGDRQIGQRAQIGTQLLELIAVARAVEQLQPHHRAGRDLALDDRRVEVLAKTGPSTASDSPHSRNPTRRSRSPDCCLARRSRRSGRPLRAARPATGTLAYPPRWVLDSAKHDCVLKSRYWICSKHGRDPREIGQSVAILRCAQRHRTHGVSRLCG